MKKRLVSIVISMLMIATVLSVAGTVNATNWPMLGGNPERTGYSPDDAPDTNNTLWTYDIPGWVSSSPVVVDGITYVGGSAQRMVALNPDGTEKWTFSTDNAVSSTPAVAEGKVVFGEDDEPGEIYCVNAETGVEEWNFTTGHWTKYSPIIINGLVYAQSFDGNLYCLYLENGTEKWSYSDASGDLAVANGHVYVFSTTGGNLLCLNADTGVVDSSIYVDEWALVLGTPVVDGDFVYFGVAGFTMEFKIYCIDLITEDIEWSYTITDQATSSCAIDDNNVYVSYQGGSWPDYIGTLLCLDKTTGIYQWEFSTVDETITSSPAVADGKVYFGSNDRSVYCLDVTDGSEIWSYNTSAKVSFSPAISDGKMYIGNHKGGRLYCFGDNQAPGEPQISGPSTGNIDEVLTYIIFAEDPDGNDLTYEVVWGDGDSETYGPFASEEIFEATHSYDTADTFTIEVTANDGLVDGPTVYLEVEILDLQPQLNVEILTGADLGVITIITNNGDATATNVDVNLTVTGGILGMIDVEVTDIIASLDVGEEVQIISGPIIGFGPITISARAVCDEGVSGNDAAAGLQLIIISIVS